MVYLWVSIAIISTLGIGFAANQILTKAIKNKEKQENYDSLLDCQSNEITENEIDELLDKKFNNENLTLNNVKININEPRLSHNHHSKFRPNSQEIKSKSPIEDDFEINI